MYNGNFTFLTMILLLAMKLSKGLFKMSEFMGILKEQRISYGIMFGTQSSKDFSQRTLH